MLLEVSVRARENTAVVDIFAPEGVVVEPEEPGVTRRLSTQPGSITRYQRAPWASAIAASLLPCPPDDEHQRAGLPGILLTRWYGESIRASESDTAPAGR